MKYKQCALLALILSFTASSVLATPSEEKYILEKDAPLAKDYTERLAAARPTFEKDIVAQVLNYTSSGKEDGSDYTPSPPGVLPIPFSFWRQIKPCVYEQTAFYPVAYQDPHIEQKTLDLNTLNRAEIQFKNLPQLYVGRSRFGLLHRGNVIIEGYGERSGERLTKGWQLVFQQCPGERKPF
jgi:hypothetical protein